MDDKTFELMEKMYAEMQSGFKKVNAEMQDGFKKVNAEMQDGFKKVDKRFEKLETEVKQNSKDIQKIQLKIENDIIPKLDVLFDGQKQQTDMLQRIESEVARHEEVILKRVK